MSEKLSTPHDSIVKTAITYSTNWEFHFSPNTVHYEQTHPLWFHLSKRFCYISLVVCELMFQNIFQKCWEMVGCKVGYMCKLAQLIPFYTYNWLSYVTHADYAALAFLLLHICKTLWKPPPFDILILSWSWEGLRAETCDHIKITAAGNISLLLTTVVLIDFMFCEVLPGTWRPWQWARTRSSQRLQLAKDCSLVRSKTRHSSEGSPHYRKEQVVMRWEMLVFIYKEWGKWDRHMIGPTSAYFSLLV